MIYNPLVGDKTCRHARFVTGNSMCKKKLLFLSVTTGILSNMVATCCSFYVFDGSNDIVALKRKCFTHWVQM